MLRLLVLLLFVANALFYAWTQGWLDDTVGVRHDGPREPQRMARQVHPEAIQVLPAASQVPQLKSSQTLTVTSAPAASGAQAASAAASTMAAASASASEAAASSVAAVGTEAATAAAAASSPRAAKTQCLEAGPFTVAQRKDVETALSALLPAKAWELRTQEKSGLWMVYMGRYNSEDTLRKKAEELRRISSIHIEFSEVRSPPELALGLSLGRFQQRANAESALAAFSQHGVRTAHIVTVRAPTLQHFVRIARADSATRQMLNGISGVTAGKAFEACDDDTKP